MSLLFGMPEGIPDDVEGALAAIQTWAGKVDGFGKWIDVVVDGHGLAGYLRVSGNGNSWALGPAFSHAGTSIAYSLMGDSMVLGVGIIGTALTVASAINAISLLIPDGYVAAKRRANNAGYMINASIGLGAVFQVTPGSSTVTIYRGDLGLYADDSGGAFTVEGQLTFEVSRS
jgi:hypothetical protein